MSTRSIAFAEGSFYHVYNRGADKRTIFKSNADYVRFIQLLYLCNSDTAVNIRSVQRSGSSVFDFKRGNQLVALGAHCLMPNHYHLIATPVVDGGLSQFMNKLGTSYSMYFNKRYQRTGNLFEGTFKAELADSDEYLKYLFSYIHLNPVKLLQPNWKEVGIQDAEKAFSYLESYSYSSFIDYVVDPLGISNGACGHTLGEREERVLLNREFFPLYFESPKDVKKEIIDWINYNAYAR